MTIPSLLKLRSLPNNLPSEDAVQIELEQRRRIVKLGDIDHFTIRLKTEFN